MANKMLVRAAVAGAIVLLAVLTNPSPERHRLKIRDSIGQRSPIAGLLGIGSIAAFASNYHSLGVASYTKVGDQVATVGAFGFVWVRNIGP